MTARPASILPATPPTLAYAARLLRDGELVAFPTETVYGLGADAGNADAVARIYALKGRPADHPMIVHVIDVDAARHWARWSERAQRLALAFWPGPLTLILPLADGAPAHACGGQSSVGLRCPSHPVAVELLRQFAALGGAGVAAPSANRFGRVSPTRATHVADDLGDEAPPILDGGPCEVGVESTIVDLTRDRPVLLRPGRIGRAELERALGEPVLAADGSGPRASGTLASHYRPATPVELVEPHALPARLADATRAGRRVGVWSRERPAVPVAHWQRAPVSADEYERLLYESLRVMDRMALDAIVVETPRDGARWEAVLDRLRRAAAD